MLKYRGVISSTSVIKAWKVRLMGNKRSGMVMSAELLFPFFSSWELTLITETGYTVPTLRSVYKSLFRVLVDIDKQYGTIN